MTDKPTPKEIYDLVYELRQAGKDDTYSLASAVLAKWGTPAPVGVEPSYTSVQLAEMVLSDCGHSSDYTPLLNRVAARIDAHAERCLDELRVGLEPKPVAREPLSATQVSGLAESAGYWHGDMSRADFINGIRYAEAAHGIKGDQHG